MPREGQQALSAIDELVRDARTYRSSAEYRELLRFVRGFRAYSPFNAMMVQIQSPGASYVAPADRWRDRYDRVIRPGARPLMVLRRFGPVMFVFDVSDTEPRTERSPRLPKEVTDPFGLEWSLDVDRVMDRTVVNARRDGIAVTSAPQGAHQAGCVRAARAEGYLEVVVRRRPAVETVAVPRRYDVVINADLSPVARYVTLLHELAHVYCGHLGSPNERWWPRREHVPAEAAEFEAESTAYVVASRLDSAVRFPPYLDGYLGVHGEVPPISVERVLTVSHQLERMGREWLPPRSQR